MICVMDGVMMYVVVYNVWYHIVILALLIDKIYYVYKCTKEFEQWCMTNTEKLLSTFMYRRTSYSQQTKHDTVSTGSI